MKKILMSPLLLLAMTAVSRPVATPQNNLKLETIVRNDTVTQIDTVITTKKIKRTEVIQRMEEVYYSDSVKIAGGKPGSRQVSTAQPAGTYVVPAQIVVTPPVGSGEEELSAVPLVPAVPPVPAVTDVSPVPADPPVGSGSSLLSSGEEVVEQAAVQLPSTPGGDYIWIPDSLKGDVARLLRGEIVAEREIDEVFNPDERVTFRGDTLNMVLRSQNLGRFDRGLFNYLYIPKGIWSIGATASYGEFSTKDLEVLDLMSDINFSGHIFSIRPYFSYFIGNNRAVGMRLGYTSGKASIGSFNVDIDEDMNFNLHDISYRSESYTAAITYNHYFGITRRGRFGIFNEVELAFSSGNSDFIRPFNGELKDTHTNITEVGLNFSPGLSVYIMDPVTFNVSFGVFGVRLRNEKQQVDGVDMGSRFTSGANFRFNIFNISFGVAVNL